MIGLFIGHHIFNSSFLIILNLYPSHFYNSILTIHQAILWEGLHCLSILNYNLNLSFYLFIFLQFY